MLRKMLIVALAGAMALSPTVAAAQYGQTYSQQQATANLDYTLDQIVSQHESTWNWYGYSRGSMHDTRVITRNYDGRVVLLRGEFKYSSGYMWSDDGWVLARLTDGQLTCLSYDTSASTNCTIDHDAESYLGWFFQSMIVELSKDLAKAVLQWMGAYPQ